MKIGIDFDDVLAQTLDALIGFHNERYGTKIKAKDHALFGLDEVWKVDRIECLNRLFEFYHSDYHKNMPPVNEVIESLEKMAKKHELVVITSRPQEAEKVTEFWLAKNLPAHKLPIHLSHFYLIDRKVESKGELCKKLGVDIFIDDSLTNAQDICNHRIPCLLFTMPWNKEVNLPKGVTRVNNWGEIIKIIEEMETND